MAEQILLDSCIDGEVAVVGNGPLSANDRQMIDKHSCVIRFNNAQNMEKGEKTTILVSRYNAYLAKY